MSGQFDAVAPNYLFLGTGLSYQPTGVTLSVGRNGTSFASVAQTSNERAVAAAADALAAGNPVYESLLTSGTAGEARQAFRQLSGQIHADIASALVNDSRYLREALNGRLRQAEGLASSSAIKADEGGAWAQLLGAWGPRVGRRQRHGLPGLDLRGAGRAGLGGRGRRAAGGGDRLHPYLAARRLRVEGGQRQLPPGGVTATSSSGRWRCVAGGLHLAPHRHQAVGELRNAVGP